MPMMLSPLCARVGAIGESRTTQTATLAQQLRNQGRTIVNLSVGEPDFETPEPIVAATARALADQRTRYGPVAGEPALRERLAAEFRGFTRDNILVTNGAKQALFSLFQILCDPGDAVIVPSPCWVSFPEQIKLAGGRAVCVATRDHQIDPGAIAAAVDARTRAILINTPNNPTGAVYSAQALTEIACVAERHGLYLIADEAYHAFTFDGCTHVRLFDLLPDYPGMITVRSFSKQYNMTGFRLGYVAAHPPVIQALTRLQSHVSGNACSFAQFGALAALSMDQAIVERRRAILEERRDFAYAATSRLFDCVRPGGAFYLFPDVRDCLAENKTSEDLAVDLLTHAGVAVVPGEAFGSPGHIRISFTEPLEALQKGFEAMEAFLGARWSAGRATALSGNPTEKKSGL